MHMRACQLALKTRAQSRLKFERKEGKKKLGNSKLQLENCAAKLDSAALPYDAVAALRGWKWTSMRPFFGRMMMPVSTRISCSSGTRHENRCNSVASTACGRHTRHQ